MASSRNVATTIEERARVRRTPREVFAFFDRPCNLKRATPTQLAVSLETHPEDLRPGTIFAYRLKRWPLDVVWDTVVSEYRAPAGFTHVKARGYFPQWAQLYLIAPDKDGAELHVRLDYEVPPGLTSSITNSYVIRDAMKEWVSEQTKGIVRALHSGT